MQEEVKSTDLMLTESQIMLANIKTRKVSYQSVADSKVINARIVTNTELSSVVSSRVAGRVERLFIKETGRTIKAGEPLYEIYSEGLLTLQQEYLLAREQSVQLGSTNAQYKSFEESARKKLLLYGLTQKQIDQLANTGNVNPRITFVAPVSGIVQTIAIAEGQNIAEGSNLYTLVNLDKLWVEADLYADEINLVKAGDEINIQFAGQPAVKTIVDFISPEFKAGSQVWVLRATIPNTGNLQPGMFTQVLVTQTAGRGLALPVQAVIRSEQGTHVYVETDKNVFQPRMIKTGIESSTTVQVTDGLTEGEAVVVSGAYLLYSEYILKHGVNPAHQH
ncbi:MAG: efflux RND transporter periplasmic adaptor subunit [Cyclobacteriaceae bacterium]|nr:efflux RND transporter periplasmic adaptor subunit [Cyclobacteriaceae bacterium]